MSVGEAMTAAVSAKDVSKAQEHLQAEREKSRALAQAGWVEYNNQVVATHASLHGTYHRPPGFGACGC